MTRSGDWVASLPFSSGPSFAGRLAMLGGTLELTDAEITFRPLGGLGRSRRLALSEIESVTAFADRPPRLRLAPKRGRALVLIVVPSRTTGVGTADTSARDDALAAINARLAAR